MMKRKKFILPIIALFIGVSFFSGCSTQKKYEMSYEQVISFLQNQSKEMMDMFLDVESQQKDLDMSTNITTDEMALDLDVKSQTRIDYTSDFTEDLSLSFDAGIRVPKSELDFTVSGALNYSLIGDDMYLKLSKFSLKGPSAKDLAMVNMVVNGFKGQWFKLNMSGANMTNVFTSYKAYIKELKNMGDEAGSLMINEGSVVYDGMFDEYKGYNAWKYSIDKEGFDTLLHTYLDTMDNFYSGFFNQYAENLGSSNEELQSLNFSELLSGITYDNLQGYFVIVGKNDVVETVEGAHMDINGTGVTFSYYYGKDGLYLDANVDDGENIMSILVKKNGKKYDVDMNFMSIFKIKGDMKFNKFSKKDGIDMDFDLDVLISTEGLVEEEPINIQAPFKGNYKVKNIDKFSLQAPSDAIDLMEMLGGYLGTSVGGDEYTDEYEYLDDAIELDNEYEVVGDSIED